MLQVERLRGTLVGDTENVRISGIHSSIYLTDPRDGNRRVRLTSTGLEVTTDGNTWVSAISGGGLNANIINDGVLTITDTDGRGVTGISIQRYDRFNNRYVENINISPGGINIYDGALTVYSEQTGEAIIGGGYLRVKGLDMGVVTSK